MAEKILLKSNAAKEKKTGFRIELRAKSNFKSNARGKLRQTIYFFWPKLSLVKICWETDLNFSFW